MLKANRKAVIEMLDPSWEKVDNESAALTEKMESYGFDKGRTKVSVVMTLEVDGEIMKRESEYLSRYR